MGNSHKQDWYLHLPWVLLSRRVALQPDIGTSSSKLVLFLFISSSFFLSYITPRTMFPGFLELLLATLVHTLLGSDPPVFSPQALCHWWPSWSPLPRACCIGLPTDSTGILRFDHHDLPPDIFIYGKMTTSSCILKDVQFPLPIRSCSIAIVNIVLNMWLWLLASSCLLILTGHNVFQNVSFLLWRWMQYILWFH